MRTPFGMDDQQNFQVDADGMIVKKCLERFPELQGEEGALLNLLKAFRQITCVDSADGEQVDCVASVHTRLRGGSLMEMFVKKNSLLWSTCLCLFADTNLRTQDTRFGSRAACQLSRRVRGRFERPDC